MAGSSLRTFECPRIGYWYWQWLATMKKEAAFFFVSFFFFFFSFVEGGNNPVPRIIPRFDEKQVWCQAPLGYSQVRALGLPLGFSHVGADPREMPPGFSGPVDFSARILIFLRHLRPCSILSPLPPPPPPTTANTHHSSSLPKTICFRKG
jgi:hypothetical protein